MTAILVPSSLEGALKYVPWLESRATLIRYISTNRELPAIFKTAALGLSLISDVDYVRMRDTFIEILLALQETRRGRALLLDMKIDALLPERIEHVQSS